MCLSGGKNCLFFGKVGVLCFLATPVLRFSLSMKLKRLEESECTAPKMKFSIKDFFSKCDRIRNFLRIWSHFLKKSLMENYIFCAVLTKIIRYVVNHSSKYKGIQSMVNPQLTVYEAKNGGITNFRKKEEEIIAWTWENGNWKM